MPEKLAFLIIGFIFCNYTYAQIDREPPSDLNSPVRMEGRGKSKLYGKVVDEKTGKPVEAASIQLFIRSAVKKTDSLIAAQLTQSNGDFSFENISAADSLLVSVTIVGYEPFSERISFHDDANNENGRGEFGRGPVQKDLGNIALIGAIKQLSGVTVVAEKPAMEMGIDRRIFSADKSMVSKGGTAIDLMKNIPSLSVDVDGNVELRNNSPQIFVDGRPTILTLDQIPADNIERVEIITNPSAKFNASSTGGIINIVLKKNKRVGLNGVVSVGAGTPSIYNGNVNLNLRQGKINFFVSGGYRQSGGTAKGSSFRKNKDAGVVTDYFNQYSENERFRRFYFVRFGADYFIDNRNTLTVTQNIVRGRFSNFETQTQEYLDINKIMERYGDRESDSRFQFNRNNTRLNFTHKFPEHGKELSANVSYNYGNGKDHSDIINAFYYPDGSPYGDPNVVRNDGLNNNHQATFQVDFTDPQGEESKIETGLRSFINNYESTFDAFSVFNGGETKLPLSNNYRYREMVNAFYFTYTGKLNSFGYQLGLRAEHSQFRGELVDSAFKFGYEYPKQIKNIWDALFPSIFLTKNFTDDEQIQLNYSRRIRRPNFWQLNPFVDINDPLNIRQGNPQLRPEFTNSFEFNYSKTFPNKSNFLGVIYYRNNNGDITRYSDTLSAEQYQRLNNAAVDPNAILNTFINSQSTNRLGAEFILQQKFGNNFDITPSIDLQYRKVNARVGDLNLSNEGFSWEGKLVVNYKIESKRSSFLNDFGFQLSGDYESPEVFPQGRRQEEIDVDFAIRKDFLRDKKATITFNINDVFNSHRYGTIYDTEDFYQLSYRRRRVRGFRLTFSYKFGDAEFSLFRRNGGRNNGNGESNENFD